MKMRCLAPLLSMAFAFRRLHRLRWRRADRSAPGRADRPAGRPRRRAEVKRAGGSSPS